MKHARLLCLMMMLLCMMTVVAQEVVSSQVCRRGTPREQGSLFRRTDDKNRVPGGDFYPGYGMNESNDSNLIWPHQWWMSEHLKDGKRGNYRNALTVSAGDKNYQIDCYCALNELSAREGYSPFGTICHEYTHCFGLPDFYSSSVKGLGLSLWRYKPVDQHIDACRQTE